MLFARSVIAASAVLSLGTSVAGAQTANSAPVAENATITTLMSKNDWTVVTRIPLQASDDDESTSWLFQLREQPAGLTCPDDQNVVSPGGATDGKSSPSKIRICNYEPPAGFTGEQRFTFQVTDNQGSRSQRGEIVIDVRQNGTRWEVVTNGDLINGDNLSNLSPEEVPEVLGKHLQDLGFLLDWQPAIPHRTSGNGLTRSAHVTVNMGFGLRPASVTTTKVPVASAVDKDNPGPPPTGNAIAAQRAFNASGTLSYNAATRVDGIGTYVEFGVLALGRFDAFVGSSDTEATGTTGLLDIRRVNAETGAFTLEIGGRIALKTANEDPDTTITAGGTRIHPTNSVELLSVEWGHQAVNEALVFTDSSGETQRTWMLRVQSSPELSFVPGKPRVLVGFELTRPYSGGPSVVRVIYGVKLAGNGVNIF